MQLDFVLRQSEHSSSLTDWWWDDIKILYLFALFGMAAGIITYIDSLFLEQDIFSLLSLPMNYPAIMMLLFIEYFIIAPSGFSIFFHPLAIIPYSIVLWSFIGLIVYSLIRMFKLGP